MKDKRHLWIAHLLPASMLLLAFEEANPYGYYLLLRFVCCAGFVLLTLDALKSDCHPAWVWAFGFAVLLYNPILRIPLDRETWLVANTCTLGLLGISLLRLIRKKATT